MHRPATFRVSQSPGCVHKGLLEFGNRAYQCALGRSGVSQIKREGDGATPAGTWKLRCLYYRPDRGDRPRTLLPCLPLKPDDGWCDDPSSSFYNRPVSLPFAASTEHMWREDELYDLVAVLGHNDAPAIPGRGSCIFLHVARPDYSPTEGCVALHRRDLLQIFAVSDNNSALLIVR